MVGSGRGVPRVVWSGWHGRGVLTRPGPGVLTRPGPGPCSLALVLVSRSWLWYPGHGSGIPVMAQISESWLRSQKSQNPGSDLRNLRYLASEYILILRRFLDETTRPGWAKLPGSILSSIFFELATRD